VCAAPPSYFSVTLLCAVRTQNFTDRTVMKAAWNTPNTGRTGERLPRCRVAIRGLSPSALVSSREVIAVAPH
jgi:hypothetical protein